MERSECAAILLAGGASRRMGRDKAALPFGAGTLAAHVAAELARACGTVVVAAAQGQTFADLPNGVVVARDAEPGLGPLSGIRTGLRALAGAATIAARAVVVTAVDAPFVDVAVARFLCGALGGHDAAAAVAADGRFRSLPITVSGASLPRIERLLAAGERSLRAFLAAVDARCIAETEWRAVDPELRAFVNVNTPDEWRDALARLRRD